MIITGYVLKGMTLVGNYDLYKLGQSTRDKAPTTEISRQQK